MRMEESEPKNVPINEIPPLSPLFTFFNFKREKAPFEKAFPVSELTVSKVEVATTVT